MDAKQFLLNHVSDIKCMENALNEAYWGAYTEGDDKFYADVERLGLEKKEYLSNPDKFKELKRLNEEGVDDPLLARQLHLVYNDFLANQLPKDIVAKMVKITTETEKAFNRFRGEVDGKKYTRNKVHELMKESDDSTLRERVWKAHKKLGPTISSQVIEVINLRNNAARHLGYPDYMALNLSLQEHDPSTLDRLFGELDYQTRGPYKKYKAELDSRLAQRFKISVDSLRPWHYADPFLQEAPQLTSLDLDVIYKGKDLVDIARQFYSSAGFDINPILTKSSLYPKEGKSEHAFCFVLDRDEPDVRILCNMKDTNHWMSILLHELGHGIYDHSFDGLPWRLREPAHILTTEGVAEMFGNMTQNPNWLREVMGATVDFSSLDKQKTLENLTFARWSLVMYHFERELYTNPSQDLNKTWWDIVEKYQMVPRPDGRDEPDWATKDHIVCAPVYYHNYILGQMFQAQLIEKLADLSSCKPEEVIFHNQPDFCQYVMKNVFNPGATIPWTELVENATGNQLGVDAWVRGLSD